MKIIENLLYNMWFVYILYETSRRRRGENNEEVPNSTLVCKKRHDPRKYWSVLHRSYTELSISCMNMLFWYKKSLLFEYEELFGQWNGLYWRVHAFSSVRLWRVAKNWNTYILPVKKGLLLQPSVQPLQPKVPLLEPLFGTGFPAPPRKSTN